MAKKKVRLDKQVEARPHAHEGRFLQTLEEPVAHPGEFGQTGTGMLILQSHGGVQMKPVQILNHCSTRK
jgi:hypothetical protein